MKPAGSWARSRPARRTRRRRRPSRAGLLFDMGDFTFAVEICEDLWTPVPPSSRYAVEGADIILNPSASNALVTKHAYRRELLKQQSGRLYAGYAYACSGFGESTSDLAFCGYTGVFESGRVLARASALRLRAAARLRISISAACATSASATAASTSASDAQRR